MYGCIVITVAIGVVVSFAEFGASASIAGRGS